MDDQQNDPGRARAVETVSRAGESANRARFWAGLNRYLAAEAQHEQKAAREERDEDDRRREAP